MAKQKPKRWWLSRDGGECGCYNIHHMVEKPKPVLTVYLMEETVQCIPNRKFLQLFKLRLREGECKELECPTLVLKTKKKKG